MCVSVVGDGVLCVCVCVKRGNFSYECVWGGGISVCMRECVVGMNVCVCGEEGYEMVCVREGFVCVCV